MIEATGPALLVIPRPHVPSSAVTTQATCPQGGNRPGAQTPPLVDISRYQSALGVSGPDRTLSLVIGAAWTDLIFMGGTLSAMYAGGRWLRFAGLGEGDSRVATGGGGLPGPR